MAPASLSKIVQHCDRLLQTKAFQDYEGAFNGLQMQNSGRITRLAAAVDASLATCRLAVAAGANLLLVHHGLFWSARHPWTKQNYELLQLLLTYDLAIYSSHLPLDAHRQLGNNRLLCDALGLKQLRPFFLSHGQFIGFRAQTRLKRSELQRRLEKATGTKAHVLPGGNDWCREIGVVSGGAGGELKVAAAEGVDTFVTGEGPHWTFGLAEELGLNVFYGGHYATETFGVKALATEVGNKFGLPWTFVDRPSGL